MLGRWARRAVGTARTPARQCFGIIHFVIGIMCSFVSISRSVWSLALPNSFQTRTWIPCSERKRLVSATEYSPKWNMLAANTASA
jgi:hypothetical protein